MSDTEIKTGTPATYAIGSDCYATEISRVSPSGKTLYIMRHNRELSFRASVRGGVFTWCEIGGSATLHPGEAETKLDPHF